MKLQNTRGGRIVLQDIKVRSQCTKEMASVFGKKFSKVNNLVGLIRIRLLIFQKPERDEWGSGLEAIQAALALEKSVNQSLLDLHAIADKHNDYQVIVQLFWGLSSHYLSVLCVMCLSIVSTTCHH